MLGILEGLLYVQGDQGLTLEEVKNVLGITEEEAKKLVYELKINYEKENRGLRINYLGNTFKLTTRPEHKEYYQRLLDSPTGYALSGAALEVLAIIAYNEPITRVTIDEMRGVESTFVLRRLVAKGLIKEAGKSDAPGRPILYKTTDDFLDYFGLSCKEDLPKINYTEEENNEKELFTSTYKEEILSKN